MARGAVGFRVALTMHPAIPKTIHYVWVGGKPLTPLARRCIESWKVHAPEYTLRFWHDDNIPRDHPYVQEMYRRKKWAFVSDYVRFWALEREGGVYLDTDMELLRPLDRFLSDQVFFGRTKDGFTACGIVGACPGEDILSIILREYDVQESEIKLETSPRIVTRVLRDNPEYTATVYPPEIFYPCNDGERCTKEMQAHAYARHHWAESWVPFARVRKIARRLGVLHYLKKIPFWKNSS